MENAWKTQWRDEGKLLVKEFEGNSPKSAVEYGKKLKLHGIAVVDVISARQAFPPPPKRAISPQHGLLWCPYCVKWRVFEEAEVHYADFYTPSLPRCTVCSISIKDAYVRMYNPELVIRIEMQQELRAARKEQLKKNKKEGRIVKGSIRRKRR